MPKGKKMKPLNPNKPSYKQPLQHDVEKAQQRDKIKPKEIFEMMGGEKKNNKRSNRSNSK